MDLKRVGTAASGERVVSNPVLHDGRITFTSLSPISTDEEPCSNGGTGWLMELDALTGGSPDDKTALFDVSKDGKLDATDMAGAQAPSGIGFEAVPNATRVVRDKENIYRITSQSTGDISVEQGPQGNQPSGRLSWRQIR